MRLVPAGHSLSTAQLGSSVHVCSNSATCVQRLGSSSALQHPARWQQLGDMRSVFRQQHQRQRCVRIQRSQLRASSISAITTVTATALRAYAAAASASSISNMQLSPAGSFQQQRCVHGQQQPLPRQRIATSTRAPQWQQSDGDCSIFGSDSTATSAVAVVFSE